MFHTTIQSDMSFKDKVVLITGGSAGIGSATAVMFAQESANVAIVGRNEERLKNVAQKCEKAGATTIYLKYDITKDEDLKSIIQRTIEKFGKLDILINNVGILKEANILNNNYMESYDLIMKTNMRSLALLTHLAAIYLIKTKGNIVNISSCAGITVVENYSAYASSKAALNHFTKCVALELAPCGVRVNAINPGPVNTDIFTTGGVSVSANGLKIQTALNEISEPEEVAELILYLASNKARSVTGSIYLIDNGYHLK